MHLDQQLNTASNLSNAALAWSSGSSFVAGATQTSLLLITDNQTVETTQIAIGFSNGYIQSKQRGNTNIVSII